MSQAGNEEGYDGGDRPGDSVKGGAVDMAPEEVVDGNVPLAGELEPIKTIPPVGVKLTISKTWRYDQYC